MPKNHIHSAGNTIAPAIVALEQMGFTVSVNDLDGIASFSAVRGDESYSSDDPVAVLGLIKLIEVRGWDWLIADSQLDDVLKRFKLC